MLRDTLVGLIEPMLSSAGANPLALCVARQKSSDDRPPCLENPRPKGDFQGIGFFDPTVSMTIYLLEGWSKGVSAVRARTSSIRLADPSRSGRASSRSFHCYRWPTTALPLPSGDLHGLRLGLVERLSTIWPKQVGAAIQRVDSSSRVADGALLQSRLHPRPTAVHYPPFENIVTFLP